MEGRGGAAASAGSGAGGPPTDERELEREIAELQKQRALEEGRLASFGAKASGSFDSELYGSSRSNYVTSISVGGDEDDEDDEDERMSEAASSIRKLTGRYPAPKSVYRDIPKPDEEADDPFAEYRKGRIADREDDYKKRRLARQLSSVSSYRERMIESAQENQKIRAVLEAEKKRKEEMEEAEKKLKERQEQLKQQEKLRRKEDKRKRKEEKKKEKRRKKRKLGEDGKNEDDDERDEVEEEEEEEDDGKSGEQKSEWDDEDEDERRARTMRTAMTAHFKHKEPSDAKKPDRPWLLHIFKNGQALAPLSISKRSCYRFGREADLSDIVAAHESCSKQHAALQFRHVNGAIRPYLIDVGSANGTFLNKQKMKPNEYMELKEGDTFVLGCSTRQYALAQERYRKNMI